MPIEDQDEYIYSTDELAGILKVSASGLAQVIADKGGVRSEDGKWRLKKAGLKDFFTPFFKTEELARPYAASDSLKECRMAWAQTLVKMYEQDISFPASLSPQQGEMLKTLVLNINPRRVLEIGSYTGISTVWMASALEQNGGDAMIHAVDLFAEIFPLPPWHYRHVPDVLQIARDAVSEAGLSHRVQFYKMNSRDMGLNYRRLINQPLDLLYIDGDHSIRGCAADFLLYYAHVRVGGYIVLHDIYPEFYDHLGPRRLLDTLIGKRHFEVLEVPTMPLNFGMAFIRKKSHDPKISLLAASLKMATRQKIVRPRLDL